MEILQGTATRRAQLDQWMDESRKALRLRWSQVAELAGMTTPNLLRIRKGKIGITWDAADGIENALQWERGSVEAAILEGRRPVAAAPPDLALEPSGSAADVDLTFKMWPLDDQVKYDYLTKKLAELGLKLTPRLYLIMKDQAEIEYAREKRESFSGDDRQ